MLTKETILSLAKEKERLFASDLVAQFSVSRQYVNRLVQELVASGQLVKANVTRGAFYVLPEFANQRPEIFFPTFKKRLKNVGLEEDKVFQMIEDELPALRSIPGNIHSIVLYAFSEMLNNAIDHSQSDEILVILSIKSETIEFSIEDFGIGVFRNVMQKRNLNSEIEAIQDILKGKTTTHPARHSGEGIFFTSKVATLFTLSSYGLELIVDNIISDWFINPTKDFRKGTLVTFSIATDSKHTTMDVFNQYSDLSQGDQAGFDITEQKVKLYTDDTKYISRSQARRMLVGMEQFKVIRLDFDRVEMIGQGFADEIFRVFQNRHPQIRIEPENMNEAVKFMVQRAMNRGVA